MNTTSLKELEEKVSYIHTRLVNCSQLHQDKDSEWIDGTCITPSLATKEILGLLAQHTAEVGRESRIDEAGLWLNMVVRNDHSRLNSNEWYKLNPRVVSRFFAERLKKLNSKDNLNSKGGE